jgi:amino acid transporter
VDKSRDGRKRSLESRARGGLELFLLVVGVFAGLGVVGGCGSMAVFGMDLEPKFLWVPAVFGATAVVVGIVFLATRMSRDVRSLREALLEKTRELESRTEDRGP